MEAYGGASYQRDVLRTIGHLSQATYYGPGFPGYDSDLDAKTVLKRLQSRPEAVIVAHSWLLDSSASTTTLNDNLDPREFDLPVIVVLNKEYARISDKLDWIARQRPLMALSHHHDVETYAGRTGVPFMFWPFAVDAERFRPAPEKTIDVGFSGILQNPSHPSSQSDIRLQLQRQLFHHIRGVRLGRRRIARDLKVDWRSFTGTRLVDTVNLVLHGRPRLSEESYAAVLATSATWINAPSPMNLVGTRYFECMATDTIVLTPYFPELKLVFQDSSYASFSSVDELLEMVHVYKNDASARREVAKRARLHVISTHTWEIRVSQMLALLNQNNL